ncbi:MAG: hypothetical protein M3462_05295 [Chloroflexota bacterium]|nr:hypothetical protein [Chloroflexota bacterium]
MLAALQDAAEETIRAHDVITLSARDRLAFAEAILPAE